MRLRLPALALASASVLLLTLAALPAATLLAQQPQGILESLDSLTQERAAHTAITFDRSELQAAQQLFGADPSAALNSITFENYHFTRPAFYDPEVMQSILDRYHAAGWKHLVNANARPGQGVNTDLWLHFRGAQIDDITVLVRGQRQMNMIQVSCLLRPLDLVHLSGHLGIPKVDPNAVMVPDPNNR